MEPSKRFAHILVPEGGKNAVALELIMNLIHKHIMEETHETACTDI